MDQASSKLLPPNPHDPATRKPEKTKLILRREENHPKTWVSLIRLGGSEKAEGNLTRLSTRSLSWSGGLEWARSRKKYWTRRSFEGALDSLKRCMIKLSRNKFIRWKKCLMRSLWTRKYLCQVINSDVKTSLLTAVDLSDGVFFRAMEWSMVFEKKPL